MPRDQLAALLIAARKKAGYPTVYAMAKATDLPITTLQETEAGNRSPTLETLERIMDAIGLEVVVTFQPRQSRRGKSR
jgi:transcriptional regulator with XRE-family HTH domain